MRTIERDVVCALIFSKDGKLFQAWRDIKSSGVYPGHWAIIGGGVEKGEDQRTALNREVLEETGLDISKYSAELIDEAQGESEKTLKDSLERVYCKMRFYTYKVVINDELSETIKITLNEEHSKYRWSTISDLKELKMTPPSVELFRKLGYL